MKVIFVNKKNNTLEVFDGVTHMHVDPHLEGTPFVLYHKFGTTHLKEAFYSLHKIED